MIPRWYDRMMAANAWVACVYAFFSAISLFGAPEHLLITERHQFIFEHVAGRYFFGFVYTVIGLGAAYAVVYAKTRWIAFAATAAISFFWAVAAIGPAMFGQVPHGNILAAISGFALSLFSVSFSLLSHHEYNRKHRD